MATSKMKMTLAEFDQRVPKLRSRMIAALDKEITDGDLPEKPGSDVFSGLPTVDSKTVCKISSAVNDVMGCSLKPRWVKKGGYPSVPKAVDDVIQNMRNEFIAGPKTTKPNILIAA